MFSCSLYSPTCRPCARRCLISHRVITRTVVHHAVHIKQGMASALSFQASRCARVFVLAFASSSPLHVAPVSICSWRLYIACMRLLQRLPHDVCMLDASSCHFFFRSDIASLPAIERVASRPQSSSSALPSKIKLLSSFPIRHWICLALPPPSSSIIISSRRCSRSPIFLVVSSSPNEGRRIRSRCQCRSS